MMKFNNWLIVLSLLSFGFYGCRSSNSPTDNPTSGKLAISVDETFKPLIDSEIATFESLYTYADVSVEYKSEAEAMNDLLNDSIRLVVVPRSLNAEEYKIFKKWEIVPRITKIAYDGVALIGSKDISDTTITLNDIKSLLTDGNTSSLKNIKVVFDNGSSSTVSFLKEKTGVKELGKNCYALDSNPAVIDYISKENNSIGVIGVNWISDRDDSTKLNFLNSVKVLEIGVNESDDFHKPYQAYIKQKLYPLWREVYILSKEAYTGLGSGFTAFLAGEKGQRIVLKFGLVPATMPVRLVEFIENEEIPR